MPVIASWLIGGLYLLSEIPSYDDENCPIPGGTLSLFCLPFPDVKFYG